MFFIIAILFINHRRSTFKALNSDYEKYANTNKGLLLFNITIVVLLLILCLLDFLLSFIPNAIYFNVGKSYYIIAGIPVLLLFNSQRHKHNKATNALIGIYMTIIGIIIVGFFIMISSEAFTYISLVAEIFKALGEA